MKDVQLKEIDWQQLGEEDSGAKLRVEVALAWCGLVWSGVVWCGLVWFGVVWCGLVWSGVVWSGLDQVVWCNHCSGMWCDMVCCSKRWTLSPDNPPLLLDMRALRRFKHL